MLPLEFVVKMLESLPLVCSEGDYTGQKENIAELELGKIAESDLDQFLCFMSVIMADHKKFSPVACRRAALQLQLQLNMKGSVPQMEQQKRWRAIAADVRDMIKSNLLIALPTTSLCYSITVVEIIACIAVMEIPLKNNWPDLVPTLSSIVYQLDSGGKESAVEALTFMCQKLKTERMAEYVGYIMAPLLASLRMDQLSNRAQQAILNMLMSCFEPAHAYFKNSGEHKIVMQAIFEAAESSDIGTRSIALSLLIKAASFCYQHLKDYIDVIIPITTAAINSEEGDIHEMGLQFWKAVSQVENPRDPEGRRILQTEQREASCYLVENNRIKIVPCLFAQLVRGEIFANLSPEDSDVANNSSVKAEQACYDTVFKGDLTLEDLEASNATEKKQSKSDTISKVDRASRKNRGETFKNKQSPDGWTPPREVIIYFSELCEDYPDTIDRYVLPLVEKKIQHADWRHRHAALWSMLVFLKQMDPKHAEKTLKHIFPLIRGVIRDKASSRIRNTALWVISWMVEKYPPLLVVPATLQDLQLLLDDLIACLNDGEGRVSPSSCIALTSVVKASHTLARQQADGDIRPPTSVLSPYYDMIADQLVKAAKRRLTAAFEALRQLLLTSPTDCYWVVLETTNELLLLLRKVVELPDRVGCQCHEAVQKLICVVLRNVVEILELGKATSKQLCHKFMTYLLSLLTKFPFGMAREEALLAVSTIAPMLDWELKLHADSLVSYLTLAISSIPKNDPALALVVDAIGTLFRVLDSEAIPYVSKLLGQLLILTDSNQNLPTEVKIRCVAAFGQMATAVGRTGFQMYMTAVLRRLHFYGELSTAEERYSSKELREKLLQTCLETYSSLIQSILYRGTIPLTLELCSSSLCLKHISKLIQSITTSKSDLAEKTRTAMAHLIGNILLEFGPKKALSHIPLQASECKSLLAEVVFHTKGNGQVASICRAALSEIEMDARRLN
ncbi:importin subunit beta-like isoform X1 [Daphnia magna]|uniref:importin subunit beta-like isoform X1 n=1 Tax=Daphnia magna TaxID=35525 RepID=UPI001E1BCD3F|nr:importin subunit beta-like isoform X1 [Daphnia magna]